MFYYKNCMTIVAIKKVNFKVDSTNFKYKVVTELNGTAFPYFTNKKYNVGDIFNG